MSLKHNVSSNWYGGNNLQQQARINECLDWYQTNLRRSSTSLMQGLFLPLMFKEDINKPQYLALAEEGRKSLPANLSIMETCLLRDNKFLCGNEVSIADLICASELLQISVTGIKIDEHPKLIDWLERVRQHVKSFDTVHKIFYVVAAKQKQTPYIKAPSKL